MATTPKPGFQKVIIAGAGPAGLLLALLLSNHGIQVMVLDESPSIRTDPRATHYAPPAVSILRKAGVLDEVRSEGFVPRDISWRKLDGSLIARMSLDVAGEYEDALTCLDISRLAHVIYDRLKGRPTVSVRFGHKVVDVGQDENQAWVEVETSGGRGRLEADYVAGCDGGRSGVRRALFGHYSMPGFTWDKLLISTNVYYDFQKHGWDDTIFIIDPENWFFAAKVSNDNMWRVTYGEEHGLSVEDYKRKLPDKYKRILPGHPDPHEYKVMGAQPYKIHQRCVKKMRVGRIMLAGDAAHLCNPWGGLGLSGGIVDVGGLADCLVGIYTHKADDSILDKYDSIRRGKFYMVTDSISTVNFKRCFEPDPETVMLVDGFLQECKRAEKDPELMKKVMNASDALRFDFTQFYNE